MTKMIGRQTGSHGFSLVETLIALALTLLATTSLLVLATSQMNLSSTTPEALDLSQRARAALLALVRDLSMAGAGPTAGPRVGPLVQFFAPLLPRKPHLDTFDTVRTDAVAIVAVPYARAQTALAEPLGTGAGLAMLAQPTNCPLGLPSCGFESGATAVVFDDEGNFEVVAIADVQPASVSLRWRPGVPGPGFRTAASFVEAEAHLYYFDPGRRQLRHHDLDRTDTPVVDNVVALEFEYFGDAAPPRSPRPEDGVENCVYLADGSLRPELVWIAPQRSLLVPLSLSSFRDGPWCGAGGTQFDADLLRVRAVRVTLRLQVGAAAFRATAGTVIAGTSRRDTSSIPDHEITFDVSPRNLAVIR